MNKPGVAKFYYTRNLPEKAVAIAKITAGMSRPADLTDITSTPYRTQNLVVTGSVIGTKDAYELNAPMEIHGSTTYLVDNQFFQLTNVTDSSEGEVKPYFYKHQLSANATDVTVLDASGNRITKHIKVIGSVVYHNLDGKLYHVSYYDRRNLKNEILRYEPVLSRSLQPVASSSSYHFSPGGVLTVNDTGSYHIRFTNWNGYMVLPPYDTLPNEPWYVRIRFDINPLPREWARQQFAPFRPYQTAVWSPGKVLSSNIVEFERRPIWHDGRYYPDLLVYSKDYKLKYALDGTPSDVRDKGYLFPWMKSQILELEPWSGRVKLNVQLEQTDLVYGFFNYEEPDLVYKELDINPHTNQSVRGRVIEFYYKDDPDHSLFRNVFYRTYNPLTPQITEKTNDPNPEDPSGTRDSEYVFGQLVVGFSVGLEEFSVEDARTRGGGLSSDYLNIPESKDCWDCGFWDGQPLPVKGGVVVHVPDSLLAPTGKFTSEEVLSKISSVLTVGSIPVLKVYNQNGEEVHGTA